MQPSDDQNEMIPDGTSTTKDMKEGQPLVLTKNEVLFIDDMLSGRVVVTAEVATGTLRPLMPRVGLPATLDLLEKIAYAVLFVIDPDNDGEDAVVYLDDDDLWLLRDIAQSSRTFGNEPVGYTLKCKLYRALIGIKYQDKKVVNRLLSQIDSM